MKDKYIVHDLPHTLAHFIEECGEALSAAGKALRWGLDSYNPELPPEQRETNQEWLERELDDVEGAIDRLREQLAGKP